MLGVEHAENAEIGGEAVRLFKLIHVLHKIKWLSPAAVFRLISSLWTYGVNLMALLHVSAKTYGNKVALADEQETFTYQELFTEADLLSAVLRETWQLGKGKKAGLLCKNHVSCVKTIFAVSSTGADLVLLNPDMSANQLNDILEQYDVDLLVVDAQYAPLLAQTSYAKATLWCDHDTEPAINNVIEAGTQGNRKPQRASSGKLVLLTGGTTGVAKQAVHRPSLFHYLDPFADFLSRLQILRYERAYVATPLYHGYGLAVMLLFFAVGKKVVLQRGFDAEKACRLIREHQIEVVTVVPLMLHRMLKTGAKDLKSLRCIASGGAELSPKLVKQTERVLGQVLYNLYGTSETGLNMIATPRDLSRSADTIGKPVQGVNVTIADQHGKEVGVGQVGHFVIKSKGSFINRTGAWVRAGDLGYRDEDGFYYLCGRADSMIVSAGENVYPRDVERVLLMHPKVVDAAVIGIKDEQYGQQLQAYVQLETGADTTAAALMAWLRPRVARFQMPKAIVLVDHLPYTPLGKLDRKSIDEFARSGSPGCST